jgi:hypothetical protein
MALSFRELKLTARFVCRVLGVILQTGAYVDRVEAFLGELEVLGSLQVS